MVIFAFCFDFYYIIEENRQKQTQSHDPRAVRHDPQRIFAASLPSASVKTKKAACWRPSGRRTLNPSSLRSECKPHQQSRIRLITGGLYAFSHSLYPCQNKKAAYWRPFCFGTPFQNRSAPQVFSKSIHVLRQADRLIPWWWWELTVSAIFRAFSAMLANEVYVLFLQCFLLSLYTYYCGIVIFITPFTFETSD